MRRYLYDVTPDDQSKWIRLRDVVDEITLTVKQITSDAIVGTREIEVGVDDFAATNALLGYIEADLTGENTIKICARYGIDLNAVPALRF